MGEYDKAINASLSGMRVKKVFGEDEWVTVSPSSGCWKTEGKAKKMRIIIEDSLVKNGVATPYVVLSHVGNAATGFVIKINRNPQ